MKPSIEVIEEQAVSDGLTIEEYLLRKTRIAVLNDEDGTFHCGREFFVVEVDEAEHIKVVDAHESKPQAKLSINGPGGELRRGRVPTSEYLVISGRVHDVLEAPIQSGEIIQPSNLRPRSEVAFRDKVLLTRPESFSRQGIIWTSNRRRR